MHGWGKKMTKNVSKRQNLHNPDIKNLEIMLDVTHEIMNAEAIQ